jgi:hypothetical protein
MTLSIYEMQSQAGFWCTEAKNDFEEPTCSSKVEAIGYLALARLSSFVAFCKSVYDVGAWMWLRVVKVIAIPIFDDLSFDSFVRAAIAFPLVISLAALRILCSIAGVISPELAYGVLKLHKLLLCLGLTCKVQYVSLGSLSRLPPEIRVLVPQIHDQRWRQEAVGSILNDITERERGGRVVGKWMFKEDIWRPLMAQALGGELVRIAQEFARPVEVSRPILEAFQRQFAESVHAEAVSAYRQRLYTQDEIEDMVTALLPILYRATYKAILQTFHVTSSELRLANRKITTAEILIEDGQKMVLKDGVLEGGVSVTVKEIPLINGHPLRSIIVFAPVGRLVSRNERQLLEDEKLCVDDIALLDGTALTERGSGGLDTWKNHLIEIVLLVKDMSESDKEALSYYLCADEARIHEVRPDLLELASRPVLARCFKLITEFYTTFIAHHMPAGSVALQEAFSLSPGDVAR